MDRNKAQRKYYRNLKINNPEKYAEKNYKTKEYIKKKYKEDQEYRESVKLKARLRYKNDIDYRNSVLERSRNRYAKKIS